MVSVALILATACAASDGDTAVPSGEADGGTGTIDGSPGDGALPPGDGPRFYIRHPFEPGGDGKLGTPDDVLGPIRYVGDLGPNDALLRLTTYSPGADQQWDTDDDVIEAQQRIVGDYLSSFDSPGPNGIWGDDDDHLLRADWFERNSEGRVDS